MLSSGAKKRQGRAALSLGISSLVEGSLKLPHCRARQKTLHGASEIDFHGRFSEHLYCNIHVPRGLG